MDVGKTPGLFHDSCPHMPCTIALNRGTRVSPSMPKLFQPSQNEQGWCQPLLVATQIKGFVSHMENTR